MSEQLVCPLCEARTAGAELEIHVAREMMLGTREPFRYGACASCGTLVLLDVPADLSRFYPPDYYSLRPPSRPRLPIRLAKKLRAELAARGRRRSARLIGGGSEPRWARWLEVSGLSREASVCDIGSGSGALLFELADAGFSDLTGVDPFIEESLQRSGLALYRCTAAELQGSYELVMLNHSFEHVADPLATLSHARRLLAPGGTVMVRCPVAGCWAWRHYGTDWVALDPPRHLFVPSLAGIGAAASRAGLRLVETIFDSNEMQFWRSEQYRRDIPLFDPASHESDPAGSPFSARQMRTWRRRAAQLNRDGDGDTAAIFLRAE